LSVSTIAAAVVHRNTRIQVQMMLAFFDVAVRVPLRVSGGFFLSREERVRRVMLCDSVKPYAAGRTQRENTPNVASENASAEVLTITETQRIRLTCRESLGSGWGTMPVKTRARKCSRSQRPREYD